MGKAFSLTKNLPTEQWMMQGLEGSTGPAVKQHRSELSCWQVIQGSLSEIWGSPHFWETGHRMAVLAEVLKLA